MGLLYGLFGVGSAFATPMLSVLGVSGMAAVVGPLPALLPGSAAGAWNYSRRGKVDWVLARRVLMGAFPAAILGALASRYVGGPVLLVLSGVVLFFVGVRVLRPGRTVDAAIAERRRTSVGFVVPAAIAVGFASGLLANGGGFLLVPLFLLALGMDMSEAAGTSLVVACTLTVPTLATHLLVGDVDWLIAGLFSLGMIPGAVAGSRGAHLFPSAKLRGAFGVLLVGFATWFLLRQLLALVR